MSESWRFQAALGGVCVRCDDEIEIGQWIQKADGCRGYEHCVCPIDVESPPDFEWGTEGTHMILKVGKDGTIQKTEVKP